MNSFVVLIISVISVSVTISARRGLRHDTVIQDINAGAGRFDIQGIKDDDALKTVVTYEKIEISQDTSRILINNADLNFNVHIEFDSTSDKNVAKMIIDCDPDTLIQVLPVFDPTKITEAIVSNADALDLEMLFQFLKPLINLESLRMNNTKFTPDYKFKERLTFPKLRNFVLDHYCEIPEYFICIQPVDKAIFKSRLFFDKGTEWNFDSLIDLKVNIRYTLGSKGIMFDLNHDSQELTNHFEFLNEDILTNIPNDFELKYVGLHRPKLSHRSPMIVDVDWFPLSLTRLSLSGVNLAGGDLSDVLRKCQNLVDVGFKILNYTKPIEMNEFSSKITAIYLRTLTLKHSPGTTLNLTTLDFSLCKFDPPEILVDNFENFFSVRDISLNFPREDSSITYSILAKALKSDVTRTIAVRQIYRDTTSVKFYNEVETTIQDLGVPKDYTSFLLLKYDGESKWTKLI